eukprot:516889_1
MSLSQTFLKVVCEQKFTYYFPKPSYHPQTPNAVIISTDHEEGSKKGIYEYNLTQNTFNKIHTYDQPSGPYNHGQFIDVKNELLYMFAHGKLGIFDLNTKEMNTGTNIENVLRDCRGFPRSTYIPSPINECHILCDHSIHYKMDMNNKNINKMKINKFAKNYTKYPK